jgi:hypothetical protein
MFYLQDKNTLTTPRLLGAKKAENASDHFDSDNEDKLESEDYESQFAVIVSEYDEKTNGSDGKLKYKY